MMQEERKERENAPGTDCAPQSGPQEDARDERIAELERLLADERYGRAVDGALAGLAFSSASAKSAFAARLTDARLPLEDGTLAGMEEFVERYRRGDPAAFADGDRPVFVRPAGGTAYTGQASVLRAAFGLE